MSVKYQAYEEYKGSGGEWLGEISKNQQSQLPSIEQIENELGGEL